jgi:hypothetical protein
MGTPAPIDRIADKDAGRVFVIGSANFLFIPIIESEKARVTFLADFACLMVPLFNEFFGKGVGQPETAIDGFLVFGADHGFLV